MTDVVSMGEPLVEFNAEVPGLLRSARGFFTAYGGDSANFAVAAARLGGRSAYLTRIGDDEFGAALLDSWRCEGVDTSGVLVDPEAFTGVYFISRTDTGHDFTYYRKGSAASGLRSSDVPEDVVRDARLLHVSGVTQAISTSACDAVFHAIELAKRHATLVSYDPNLRPALWPPALAKAIALASIQAADIVLPNLDEGRALTGLDEPREVLAALRDRTDGLVVLKLGADGVLLGLPGGDVHVPPYKVVAVDATGAGDAFAAAFAVRLLAGFEPEEAARFAVIAGALTTTGKGAIGSVPVRLDVERRLLLPN
ncbi:sugar kinase [Allokutzneria sp. A3M-2-11 16]|uniref:sugar kinase n=1 Tax=Allokutzneria sp. A3M-2-11 16 TaxID=2962043 RepID=UPI0020B84E89|nr:PfkB family carbohydrate kinase [Allokutzneria sp. A3M-2-11 16]MCP3804851.1 sugar kinase [Allokutzneria sp. A3M-2-11 16]